MITYVAGMNYEDVKFLSVWSGKAIDFHAVSCAAMGHSSAAYQQQLEMLLELEYEWRSAGGSFPIDERQMVFPPPPPKKATSPVPGRVPAIGGSHLFL